MCNEYLKISAVLSRWRVARTRINFQGRLGESLRRHQIKKKKKSSWQEMRQDQLNGSPHMVDRRSSGRVDLICVSLPKFIVLRSWPKW